MLRFFKKYDPRQKLLLSTGAWFEFPAYGEYGTVATDDGFLIGEFEKSIARQRGGISEISESEFHELKKKPKLSKRFGPEKISPQLLKRLQRFAKSAGPADDNTVDLGETFRNISSPIVESDYKPLSRKAA